MFVQDVTPALPIDIDEPLAMCPSTFKTFVSQQDNLHLKNIHLDITLQVNKHGKATRLQVDGRAPMKLKRFIRQSATQVCQIVNAV